MHGFKCQRLATALPFHRELSPGTTGSTWPRKVLAMVEIDLPSAPGLAVVAKGAEAVSARVTSPPV